MRRARIGLALVLALAAPLALATPAGAHGAGESKKAVELVQQAIALIVNKPGDLAAAEEKVNDALKAPDKAGVDLPSVEQAKTALESRDAHRGRALLERAIGAKPHLSSVEPLAIREIPAERATGAEPGTKVATDPLPGRRGLETGDGALLLESLAVGVIGMGLAVRFRPTRGAGAPSGRGAPEEA